MSLDQSHVHRFKKTYHLMCKKCGTKLDKCLRHVLFMDPQKIEIPSGKLTSLLKIAIYSGFMWIYPSNMVIFHSYVGLPEGNCLVVELFVTVNSNKSSFFKLWHDERPRPSPNVPEDHEMDPGWNPHFSFSKSQVAWTDQALQTQNVGRWLRFANHLTVAMTSWWR